MNAALLALALPTQAPPSPAPPPCPGGVSGLGCSVGRAITDPGGAVKSAAGAAASSVAGSAFESMVNALKEGVGKSVGLMMSFWMKVPIPSIADPNSAVTKLRDATLYLTVITAVVSIFFVAARAALAHRQAATEDAAQAAKGLVHIVVASAVAVPAVILASQAADEYSAWLVSRAANGDVDAALSRLTGFTQIAGVGFTFILALLALVASVVQAFLIVIRDALLILLVGALPLAAASSITRSGQATFTKMTGWLLAFILFKPVAAMCYAAALWSVTDSSTEINQIAGIFLVILAVFTLPALMRLIVPQVERVGGASGTALLGAAAGSTGAAPTGAVPHTPSSSGGGGRAPQQAKFLGEQRLPESSPSGATGGGGGGAGGGGATGARAGGGGGPKPPGGGAGAPTGAGGGGPTGGAGGGGGGGAGSTAGAGAGAAVQGAGMAAQKAVQAVKGTGQVAGSTAEGAVDGKPE
jgi:hypothetical protein